MTRGNLALIHRFGDIEVNVSEMTVRLRGHDTQLKARPFSLLKFLIDNRDRVVPKDEILDYVWEGRAVSDAALTTAVRDIRRAIGESDSKHSLIRTYYGRGLRLIASEEVDDARHDLQTSAAQQENTPIRNVGTQSDDSELTQILVVLPYECRSTDLMLQSFVKGLMDDLTTKISLYRDWRVASRASIEVLVRRDLTVAEISSKLGAAYLVEGSVRSTSAGIRITTQLTDPDSETGIWNDQTELLDGFAIEEQDAFTSGIAASVINILNDYILQRAAAKSDKTLTLHECYLLALARMRTFDRAAQKSAVELFERVIDGVPGFAGAYAGLSYALNISDRPDGYADCSNANDRRTPVRERALALAQKSIDIDQRFANGWIALARSLLALGEIGPALAATDKALEINPDLAWGHYLAGYCNWLENRPDAAIASFDRALETSPEDSLRWSIVGGKACAFILLGRFEEAIGVSHSALASVQPQAGYLAGIGEICALGHLGRSEEGRRVVELIRCRFPEFSMTMVEHDLPLICPDVRAKILTGLRASGLPDLPFPLR